MTWIEDGYLLLWTVVAPERKELSNAPSAMEHNAFMTTAVAEMLSAGVVTLLLRGQKPMAVMSPLGLVLEPHTNKYRPTVNLK